MIRTTRIVVAVALVATSVTVSAQLKDRSKALLQAAIKQELVDGDLQGAIEKFKEVVRTGEPDVAAEALLHMAACYDRLGDAQARTTYERVVREYPAQKKAVARAQAWLDAHRDVRVRSDVRVEQILTGNITGTARPSSDGRYLPFVDWSSGHGNLAVRDVATGSTRLLTRDASSNGWAAGPIISVDGKHIAYGWEGGKDDSIRVIGSDGTHMRILARREYGDFLQAWSPNGQQIAAIHYNYSTDQSIQIILISARDGSITSLKSTGWQEPTIGGFSPDGRFLVYSVQTDESGKDAVFALAVDGSREMPVVQDAHNNWSPVWSPTGDRIVFLSNRSGSAALWSIRIVDGRPQGDPQLVRANMAGTTALGFTKDGSFYYRAGNVWRDAHEAEFDPSMLAASKPALVTDRFVGSNSDPALSPDGTYVAFVRRTAGEGPGAGQSLIVRSRSSGDERTIATGAPLVNYGRLLWFPDSRSLLVLDNPNNNPRFRAIDVKTGSARTVFEPSFKVWNTAALSPDGKALFYTRIELGPTSRTGPGDLKSIRLVKRHLDTGHETELHRAESTGLGFFGLTISSDGSTLGFSVNVADRKRSVMVMPADGGAPREIMRMGPDDLAFDGAMIWTKDRRHLIAMARCGTGNQQLCAIPVEGGAPKPLGLAMTGIRTRTEMMSADGRLLFFTSDKRSPEVWVVRNLLPSISGAR